MTGPDCSVVTLQEVASTRCRNPCESGWDAGSLRQCSIIAVRPWRTSGTVSLNVSQTDLDTKLVCCFHAVFPDLNVAQIRSAATTSLPAWDSVAMISLLNVIAEEFGIDIDWEKLDEITSYTAIRSMVAKRAPVS